MTYKFSVKSKNILNSINPKLQKLFNEVIKYYDISIISGFRTVEEQQKLFKQGSSKCDGVNKISKHQTGNAVDIVPYPINWEDINKFCEVAGCIKTNSLSIIPLTRVQRIRSFLWTKN